MSIVGRRLLVLFVLSLMLQSARAQLSKGWRILQERGLQIEGNVEYDDFFNIATYTNAGFNSINWLETMNPDWEGPPPGYPWSRWATDPTQMPPLAGEAPFMSQLIAVEMADEPDLDDGATFTNEVEWFNSAEPNFPNVILYVNNWGGQISDTTLGNFIAQAQPDMLCFDEYPFESDYNSGTPLDGPFTSWLSQLWRYRQWGINSGLPCAAYMQTFNAVQSYNTTIYRNPSGSELRYNATSALAFNVKFLIDFTYNTGATSLFNILPNGYSGDTYTNALYNEASDCYKRCQNLGKSLVCLKPIYDLHNSNDVNPPPGPASAYPSFADGTTTSILILKSKPGTTNDSAEPVGFADDPSSPKSFSWWEYQKNDPYLNGWAVTNLGTNNGGSPGQVFIAWFKLLDPSLDSPAPSNEVYFLVVNGLTATNGGSTDCQQTIKLNFETGTSSITAVDLLDPESGLVTSNNMPVIAGSGSTTKRQLVLTLNGGDAVLFKYHDGTPFVGQVAPAMPQASITIVSNAPAITFSGTIAARYQVQSSPSLDSPLWTTLTNVIIATNSYTYDDFSATNTTFYRVVGVR